MANECLAFGRDFALVLSVSPGSERNEVLRPVAVMELGYEWQNQVWWGVLCQLEELDCAPRAW